MRFSLTALSSFLLLLFALLACREADVGTTTRSVERVHRLFTFHTGLLPLLERIRYSGPGPASKKAEGVCGDLRLAKGDTASFPSHSSLTYLFTPLDSCNETASLGREGTLQVTFHGVMDEVGSKIVLKSDGFRSGDLKMKGRTVIERKKDHWNFRWKGTEFRLDGRAITMIGEMEVVRLLGAASKGLVRDDRYGFRPEFKGRGIGEASYQVRYQESIERDMGCRWPWKGVLWVKPRDIGVRELEYGNGKACRDSGKVMVNGKAVRIGFDQ